MSLLFILLFKQNGNRLNLTSIQVTRPFGNPIPPCLLGNSSSCAVKHIVKTTQYTYLSCGNPILLIIMNIYNPPSAPFIQN